MPHAIIDRLVIHPPTPDGEISNPRRALHGSIDGVPIALGIPLDIPLTKAAIRDYLLSILPEIQAAYEINVTLQPIHNLDISQEFDFQWPDE